MIDAGTYKARATGPQDVVFGRAQSGNVQVAVLFDLIDASGAPSGERISWLGTFAPGKATEIAIRALRACGWQGVDLADMTGVDSNVVELVVEIEQSDSGRSYPRVRWINTPSSGRVQMREPLRGAELRAFAAELRGVIAGLDGGRAPSRAAQPRATTTTTRNAAPSYGSDDDIPF